MTENVTALNTINVNKGDIFRFLCIPVTAAIVVAITWCTYYLYMVISEHVPHASVVIIPWFFFIYAYSGIAVMSFCAWKKRGWKNLNTVFQIKGGIVAGLSIGFPLGLVLSLVLGVFIGILWGLILGLTVGFMTGVIAEFKNEFS